MVFICWSNTTLFVTYNTSISTRQDVRNKRKTKDYGIKKGTLQSEKLSSGIDEVGYLKG